MGRKPRIIAPGVPHHVTQSGNRGQNIFLRAADFNAYLEILAARCEVYDVAIWAYCLMPNHVHLIAVPADQGGLTKVIGEAHRRYASFFNQRQDTGGHLWRQRFYSFPMDEPYLVAAARYVELNPVRAGLVERAEEWRWSSARAHLEQTDDQIVRVEPLLSRIPDWSGFLESDHGEGEVETLRRHGHNGHPLGGDGFMAQLESLTGHNPRPRPRGRPRG